MTENNQPQTKREYLTNLEIATQLGVSVNTVRNYKCRGFLPHACSQEDINNRLAKVEQVNKTIRSFNGLKAITDYRTKKNLVEPDETVEDGISKERQIDLM